MAFPNILNNYILLKAKIWSILAFKPGFELRQELGRAFQILARASLSFFPY